MSTKADAERDGVKVPMTLAEYCIQTKVPSHDSSSDLLYDDLYDDDIEEEEDDEDEAEASGIGSEMAGDCIGDEDDSGNEESWPSSTVSVTLTFALSLFFTLTASCFKFSFPVLKAFVFHSVPKNSLLKISVLFITSPFISKVHYGFTKPVIFSNVSHPSFSCLLTSGLLDNQSLSGHLKHAHFKVFCLLKPFFEG